MGDKPMDFSPRQRIASRLNAPPTQLRVAHEQLLPVFLSLAPRSSARQFMRCEFRGFYEPEQIHQRRYVWTTGHATVDCYFPAPAAVKLLWIELSHTAPGGSIINVRWDNELVLSDHEVEGSTTVAIQLPTSRVVHHVKLEILTETFNPKLVIPDSNDVRELGISVRSIVFARRRKNYRRRMDYVKPWKQLLSDLVMPWRRRRAA